MLRPRNIALSLLVVMALACCTGLFAETPSADRKPSTANHQHEQKAPDFISELEARDAKPAETNEPPVFMTALGFISKLALVLGLAYLTILGLKRVTAMKPGAQTGKQSMRVVESLTLGANRQLHLIKAGSRTLVLASTPSQVSLITELNPEDVAAVEAAQDAQSGQPHTHGESFGEQLKMFLGGSGDGSQSAGNVAQTLRDSGTFLLGKAAELGKVRKRLRNGQDD